MAHSVHELPSSHTFDFSGSERFYPLHAEQIDDFIKKLTAQNQPGADESTKKHGCAVIAMVTAELLEADLDRSDIDSIVKDPTSDYKDIPLRVLELIRSKT